MACCLAYCELELWEQTSLQFDSKSKNLFIHENVLEIIIYEMAAISSEER